MDNIKFIELRKKNKLSQVLLSEKMYVSVSTIRNWERGLSMPTINDMKKLASIFNVDDSTIVSIFSSIKTDVEARKEEEDRYQKIFVEIFWSCYKVKDFFLFCYLSSYKQLSGILTYNDYVFPFTKVISKYKEDETVFLDSIGNCVVLNKKSIIKTIPLSIDFDVYSFDVVVNYPVFPVDLLYCIDSFSQKFRLSLFEHRGIQI